MPCPYGEYFGLRYCWEFSNGSKTVIGSWLRPEGSVRYEASEGEW